LEPWADNTRSPEGPSAPAEPWHHPVLILVLEGRKEERDLHRAAPRPLRAVQMLRERALRRRLRSDRIHLLLRSQPQRERGKGKKPEKKAKQRAARRRTSRPYGTAGVAVPVRAALPRSSCRDDPSIRQSSGREKLIEAARSKRHRAVLRVGDGRRSSFARGWLTHACFAGGRAGQPAVRYLLLATTTCTDGAIQITEEN